MNYSEYRNSFDNVEDFMLAFGQLTYEEAHALVAKEDASVTVKACMMTTWKQAKAQYEKTSDADKE